MLPMPSYASSGQATFPTNTQQTRFIPPHPASFMGSLNSSGQPTDSMFQGLSLDPNSPEQFHQNIRLALVEVEKLQIAARTVLSRVQSAYHPDTAPSHTQADIARLHAQLESTIEVLRYSGVGALPLILDPTKPIPTEQELLANTTRSLQILYDKLQRSQESAATVGNLLGSERDTAAPPGALSGGRSVSEILRKS